MACSRYDSAQTPGSLQGYKPGTPKTFVGIGIQIGSPSHEQTLLEYRSNQRQP